jgi:CubicO group peptidase (beta-lactamase class C family)
MRSVPSALAGSRSDRTSQEHRARAARPVVERLDSRILMVAGALAPVHVKSLVSNSRAHFGGLQASASESALGQRVGVALNSLLATGAPGFSVAIVEHGKVVVDQGFGYADLSTKSPVTSDTSFDVASLTKTFTAFGIMLLYQKSLGTAHQINLNAPIGDYITKPITFEPSSAGSFTLPQAWRTITVRQLLTMTSGIEDNPSGQAPIVTQLNEMPKTLLFAPGTKYYYSNVNFWLLAAIIQEQSGPVFGKAQSYSEFITSHILKRLGMNQTTILQDTETTGPNSATPYTPYSSKTGWQEIPPSQLETGQAFVGAGDITSTAQDMSLYLSALLNGKLLTRLTYRTFWSSTPVIGYPYGGSEADNGLATPGLGWDNVVWTQQGPAIVEKNGSLIGFQSQINLYPLTKDGIFISYNIGLNDEASQTFDSSDVIELVHQAMESAAIVGSVTAPPSTTTPQGGWQVYVDTNQEGHDDYGDPEINTSADGAFTLNNLPPGTWTVRIANPPKGDTSSFATVTVVAGKAYFNTNLVISAS